jgi:amidase
MPSTASSSPKTWQQIAHAKRSNTNALIPSKWLLSSSSPYLSKENCPDATKIPSEILSSSELEMTSAPTEMLLQNLREGKWSAVQVTEAFCHRAALAHQLTNCLAEIFFSTALSRAQELDTYFKTHKRPIGSLHGLPVSLKDTFRVAGVETGMGYVGWLGKTETKESQSGVVNALERAGAVFYVKTNVPTSLMSGETDNNIMGYTWNPNNRNLSSGGSSGGEAALIAMNGSPLGMGTDIAGSIRIPAAANGIYGFRPSHGRLPTVGVANSVISHFILP